MYSQCPLCLLTQLALLVNITTCGGAMPTPGAPDTPYVKEQVRLNHVWWNQPDAKKADETMAGELSSGNNHLHLNFLIVAIYVMINTTYFVVVQDLHFNPNVRTTRLVCLVKNSQNSERLFMALKIIPYWHSVGVTFYHPNERKLQLEPDPRTPFPKDCSCSWFLLQRKVEGWLGPCLRKKLPYFTEFHFLSTRLLTTICFWEGIQNLSK